MLKSTFLINYFIGKAVLLSLLHRYSQCNFNF